MLWKPCHRGKTRRTLEIQPQRNYNFFDTQTMKITQQENPNPIEQLAQQLDPILFSLAVKTSFDFESIEDFKFIQIQGWHC
jgi:hypothetical protein